MEKELKKEMEEEEMKQLKRAEEAEEKTTDLGWCGGPGCKGRDTTFEYFFFLVFTIKKKSLIKSVLLFWDLLMEGWNILCLFVQ